MKGCQKLNYNFDFQGFETLEVQDNKIELPSVSELLSSPMFIRASAEDVYKHGGEINRKLLNLTPLKNNKKHVVVHSVIQHLSQKVLAVPSSDWHCDGHHQPYFSGDIHHIMMNDTSNCYTQFLENSVSCNIESDKDVNQFDFKNFSKLIENNSNEFVPKDIETNKMYTFTCRHVHRGQIPKRPEFRFFWKVTESDYHIPLAYSESRTYVSKVFLGNYGLAVPSIEQNPNSIVIRDYKN
jgi:hypothetical protein